MKTGNSVVSAAIIESFHSVLYMLVKAGKIERVVILITDPPPTNSTTIHSRLVHEDHKLFLEGTTYLPGPAKPPELVNQCCDFEMSLTCATFFSFLSFFAVFINIWAWRRR